MTERIIVSVFPAPSCFGPSAGCGPSCAPTVENTDLNEELFQRIREVRETFRDSVKIEVANYTTQRDIVLTINKLLKILEASGRKDLIAAVRTMGIYAYSLLLPLIAINGKVAFCSQIPSSRELIDHIKTVGQG